MGLGRLAGGLLRAGALVLAASVVVFLVTEGLPGDALQLRTGGRADAEEMLRLRAEAGLDRPLPVRYVGWLAGLVTGDLGSSLVTGRPVADVVVQRLPVSLTLTVAALLVAVPLSVAAAVVGVRGPRPLRTVVTWGAVSCAAVPQVVVAAALAFLLAEAWGLVPPVSLLPAGAQPWQRPDLLVLPVLTLALPTAAYVAGLLRGALLDVDALPVVRDADVRGVGTGRVLLCYLLPLVAVPLARMLAVVTGALVAGTALAETLFGIAGLGELLVTAVGSRDVPVVQAVAMLAAAAVAAGLVVGDAVAVGTDPRRPGRAHRLVEPALATRSLR